ncbi:GyrI-like domain-containing protein [Winogradskyella pulchriflava]|uniref:GyrI-like domain-containing protein n=1 Tax=Winogradskyella pulchriflava TaxID=1110688 RepID=A0ABV6QBR4_9FLAO
MNSRIVNLQEKKVIGLKSKMLQHEYGNIVALWKQFMPKKKEILNALNTELIALQDYSGFGNFEKPFDIWACVEVADLKVIPEGMLSNTIPEGLYAVIPHKGMDASATYQRIMTDWLPNSGYQIDDRPHFQVMGEKYKNGSPDSEEDFYVPIKLKS